MIALMMVVGNEFGDGTTQPALLHEDHPIQAFLFDRANEALRIRIAVRCQERRPNDPDTLLFEELQHGTTPLAVPIANQHAPVCQDAIDRIR